MGTVGEAAVGMASIGVGVVGVNIEPARLKPHRICCLALCGIHLGPLRYLKSSSLVKPYIQVGFCFGVVGILDFGLIDCVLFVVFRVDGCEGVV